MTRSALKWEYDYKRSEEERESLESSMEKLRSEMDKTEAKKKALNEKVFIVNFGVTYMGIVVEKPNYVAYEPACLSTQFIQCPCYSLSGKYNCQTCKITRF